MKLVKLLAIASVAVLASGLSFAAVNYSKLIDDSSAGQTTNSSSGQTTNSSAGETDSGSASTTTPPANQQVSPN